MTERLAHRDLRNRSAEVLRDVAAGATYEITNHGAVVAVLSPPNSRADLRIRRPTVIGGFGNLPRVRSQESSESVLADLRDES